jgi:MEDS: MEthanogen/methylotroph, DcmR Sensory domain
LKTNVQIIKNVDQSTSNTHWQHSKADIFWGEIAPCDHVVQIYEDDNIFLDSLAGFVGAGINAGDSCIVIATGAHLKALETRLINYGVHLESLIVGDHYIPLDAEETLSKFMIDGWPDEKLFNQTISSVISRAGYRKRRIRAFGEMVALLWAQGLNGATVHLEHLWNKFCEQKSFCLYCAYPKSGFTEDINSSLSHICSAHTKMIGGSHKQLTEVMYRDILQSKTG